MWYISEILIYVNLNICQNQYLLMLFNSPLTNVKEVVDPRIKITYVVLIGLWLIFESILYCNETWEVSVPPVKVQLIKT